MDEYLKTYLATTLYTVAALVIMAFPVLGYEIIRGVRSVRQLRKSNAGRFSYSLTEFAAFLSIWTVAVPFLALQFKKCLDNWGLDMLEINKLAMYSGCALAIALLASVAMLRIKLEHRATGSNGDAAGTMLWGAAQSIVIAAVLVFILVDNLFLGAVVR